jgi:trimeric autotransporter adhesin
MAKEKSVMYQSTSINHSAWLRGVHLSALVIVVSWLALSPQAGAVCREGCTGVGGTFLGDDASTRHDETAIGAGALTNRLGVYRVGNTANGANALYNNTSGNRNVAVGSKALFSNEAGFDNTANGANALYSNTSGNRNVADGYNALFGNEVGNFNTAIGFRALYQNTGSNNVALGFNAGSNLTTGSGNVCIGYNVLGVGGESNTTRISNIYSSVASGRAAYINSDNKVGTLVSSRRFKEEIKPMEVASEGILALKPVTFRYKKEIEPGAAIMFGLIAEDVEKVDPDLVTRNDKGEPETVRYEAVNAMLLNEFLKQHRTVEEQDRMMEEQDRTVAQQEAEIRALASQLQKVSNEFASVSPSHGGLEVNGQAPQMIGSNQ